MATLKSRQPRVPTARAMPAVSGTLSKSGPTTGAQLLRNRVKIAHSHPPTMSSACNASHLVRRCPFSPLRGGRRLQSNGGRALQHARL